MSALSSSDPLVLTLAGLFIAAGVPILAMLLIVVAGKRKDTLGECQDMVLVI